MKKNFFTIIIVSYNPGEKLFETIRSVEKQTFTDYRILVKDGMSTDGSIEKLKEEYDVAIAGSGIDKTITLLESCDNGIYHGMNIATAFLKNRIIENRAIRDDVENTEEVKLLKAGEEPSYIFFLNCGDRFYDENVLKNMHDAINNKNAREGTTLPAIYYGDIFDRQTGHKVASNPQINDYACYRNVPSHQACFYDERLIYKNPFDLNYKVRADYEQFLRCFYRDKASTYYVPIVVSSYEGGGYSDQNKKLSEEERREIIKHYLTGAQIRRYDFLRIVTLSKLRTALASNKITAGFYNAVKTAIYGIKGGKEE
ncbi:glycosyltransferase [Butyrivibrio proteoclasticus]|uniref:glycosyltransferase n=1 Tax=Butyrivibrio proteoclasticus TaxID=43305 RepID=UPI000478B01A|nr:glycosyltransferase [Butyrivibrio proteoclasticus]